jgi:hypothetical protein
VRTQSLLLRLLAQKERQRPASAQHGLKYPLLWQHACQLPWKTYTLPLAAPSFSQNSKLELQSSSQVIPPSGLPTAPNLGQFKLQAAMLVSGVQEAPSSTEGVLNIGMGLVPMEDCQSKTSPGIMFYLNILIICYLGLANS